MMSTNAILLAILSVEPLAYIDYRRTPEGVEWACYREGGHANAWHDNCESALAAYAAELQAAAEEQDRKSDEAIGILSEAIAQSVSE